jgi:hypothetical protein
MAEKIFHSEIEGVSGICFNMGLDSRTFAQAGLAKLLTMQGIIVKTDGKTETWKISGVVEKEDEIIVWGPDFAGEPFAAFLSDAARKDDALDAIRHWIRSRLVLAAALPSATDALATAARQDQLASEALNTPQAPLAPAFTFIGPDGSLFFPPLPLAQRCAEAENAALEKTERYVHPDLRREEAAVFTLGCMLYRLFCGKPAFPSNNIETLHQDMREGVFFPPRFAAPGLDDKFCQLLTASLDPAVAKKAATLKQWGDFLGAPSKPDSAKVDSYLHELNPSEMEKLAVEREKFTKNRERTVKTRRFAKRNRNIIIAVVVAVVVMGAVIGGTIRDRANQPNTKGMLPREVVETYYQSIGKLDHLTMQGCVIKKAGKNDIDMTSELYVLSKVRQAYEMNAPDSVMAAQDWIDSGAAPTEKVVFGASGLRLQILDADESDGEVSFRVAYSLWAPAFNSDESADGLRVPGEQARVDELRLVLRKDQWRIAEIKRRLG